MKRKINVRLALIAIIAVIATTIGLTAAYYNLFERQVRNDLRVSAQLLEDSGLFQKSEYDELKDLNLSAESMEKNSEGGLRVTWVDTDGTVLYDNEAEAADLPNHGDRPEIQEALASGSGESVRQSDTLKLNTFYYALRLEDGTVIRVSTEARSITSVFMSVFPYVILVIVAIILVCIWLSHMLTRQLLVPIEEMAEHIDDTTQNPVYKELEPFADKIRSQHENILAAVKSRQDFTANISHELKTPLTAISGYAELIENHMVGPNQEVEFARQIRNNAERLVSLINDIIRLSELDHRELSRKYESLDLYQVAMECCKDLQINAKKKEIYLSCRGTSQMIAAEKSLLGELITNLVQNAIQYNNPGGYVQITVGRNSAGESYLSVADDGIGIPAEMQDRVFERFYRVDKSRSRATGGTGLGLAIVKHIAEIHDAQIELKSQVGRGTTVTVVF